MIEIALPLAIKFQSKDHACIYDAKGNYLATTRADCADMVKAAFEASVANGTANQSTEEKHT